MYSDRSVPTFQRNLPPNDGSIIASLRLGHEKVEWKRLIPKTSSFVTALNAERVMHIIHRVGGILWCAVLYLELWRKRKREWVGVFTDGWFGSHLRPTFATCKIAQDAFREFG